MGQRLSTRNAPVLPHGKAVPKGFVKTAKPAKVTKPKKHGGKRAAVNDAPQLVAHLGQVRRRTSGDEGDRRKLLQSAIAELTSDMEVLRAAAGSNWASTMSQLLEERSAPMLLLDAEELDGRTRLPCYGDVEASLVAYGEVDPEKDTVVFVSHRWFRPGVPDGIHGEKVSIVREILREHVAPKAAGGRVLIWWDYFSIAQTAAEIHTAVKGAQILAIPFYLAASDALVALRGGDEDSYAPEVVGNADGGLSHSGRYDNRVWTMLELFGFTSDFAMMSHARRSEGAANNERPARLLVDCQLQYECQRLVARSVASTGRLEQTRCQLHDTPGWTLPPGENLTDQADLKFIEPMVIALAVPSATAAESSQEATERMTSTTLGGASLSRLLHTATSFGFEHAVNSFLGLMHETQHLDARVDAEDASGHTALGRAVFCNQLAIVRQLLNSGADFTCKHRKLGTTPLQTAISLRRFAIAEVLLEAHEAKRAPLPVDAMGRTCLHIAACTQGAKEAKFAETAGVVDPFQLRQLTMLLRLGVDPTTRDDSGRTALDLLHASGDSTTLAALEALMTEEQRAACLPRTTLAYDVDLPPVPRVAVRSRGSFTPDDGVGATYLFDRFAPRDAAAAAAGPKVFLLSNYVGSVQEELMELLVDQFAATVWQFDLWPIVDAAHQKTDGVWTNGLIGSYVTQFIHAECGGRVDCAIGWCMPGEWICRAAAADPHSIGSVVLCATPASPPDQNEFEQMRQGMLAMITQMTPLEAGKAFLAMEAPSLFANNRTQMIERYAAEMDDIWIARSKDQGSYEPQGFFDDFARHLRYWRHWSAVEQPTLLLAGADDMNFLAGMENLASVVPNARLEWSAGVGHMPMVERPTWYRKQVLGFVESQGFARLRVEEL